MSRRTQPTAGRTRTGRRYSGSAYRRIKAARRDTQRLFQNASTLYLAIDSERLEVPVKDHHNDFYELNRLLAESARAEISREDLPKLIAAKSLEGKWGDVEFKLSEGALTSLKDFISRQFFAASDR